MSTMARILWFMERNSDVNDRPPRTLPFFGEVHHIILHLNEPFIRDQFFAGIVDTESFEEILVYSSGRMIISPDPRSVPIKRLCRETQL